MNIEADKKTAIRNEIAELVRENENFFRACAQVVTVAWSLNQGESPNREWKKN